MQVRNRNRQPADSAPESPSLGTDPSSAQLSGAEIIVRELERQGVTQVAGIPGGAILPLYDALSASRVEHVLCRHEQGATFVAQGVARCTGRAGVCLATSGPGATNLVTGLADALSDSVPLVAITAQVPQQLIGTQAFQEVDTCAIAQSVTKACWFASDVQQLAAILRRAFRVAETGRRGPVLIDVPKDVLTSHLTSHRAGYQAAPVQWTDSHQPPRARAVPRGRVEQRLAADEPKTWAVIADELASSQRPLLLIGGGAAWSGAQDAVRALASRVDAAVTCTLHGLCAAPTEQARTLGMIGMHGHAAANRATEEADLVLAVGVRFDDRATGDPTRFCRKARIVHLDADERELGRLKSIAIGIATDAKAGLTRLVQATRPQSRPAWQARLATLVKRDAHPNPSGVAPIGFLRRLRSSLESDCVVTTDVGQHQMWVAQHLELRHPQRLLTSGGLGTMGFGLPAAIGASIAKPHKQITCVTGDGSLLMNLQELATLAERAARVAVVVLNNAQLGMVRQQQDHFYGGRRCAVSYARRTDFRAIAEAFGIPAVVGNARDFPTSSLREALAGRGPVLIEVLLDPDHDVLPMVPAGSDNLNMVLPRPSPLEN